MGARRELLGPVGEERVEVGEKDLGQGALPRGEALAQPKSREEVHGSPYSR